MNPQAIPMVKNAIRSINTNDLSDFMDAVMHKTTADEVQVLVERHFGAVVSQIEPERQEQ
jgi:phosphotransferase system enzyme I (PtsI)